MKDFLTNLAAASLGVGPRVKPRVPSLFEPVTPGIGRLAPRLRPVERVETSEGQAASGGPTQGPAETPRGPAVEARPVGQPGDVPAAARLPQPQPATERPLAALEAAASRSANPPPVPPTPVASEARAGPEVVRLTPAEGAAPRERELARPAPVLPLLETPQPRAGQEVPRATPVERPSPREEPEAMPPIARAGQASTRLDARPGPHAMPDFGTLVSPQDLQPPPRPLVPSAAEAGLGEARLPSPRKQAAEAGLAAAPLPTASKQAVVTPVSSPAATRQAATPAVQSAEGKSKRGIPGFESIHWLAGLAPAAAAPSVHVTIGRIEVRASPAAAGRPQAGPAGGKAMSLEEYLRRRAA